MRNKLTTLLATCLLAFSSAVVALPDDRNQPIHISADSASIDENTGITAYSGDVTIRQGSLEIDAEHVQMHRNDDGVEKIIATGNSKQARFRQQPNINDPVTDALGDRLVYLVDAQTITVTGKAFVKQGKDKFSGEKIIYDIDRSIVDAFGSQEGKGNGRVQMVIQPKAKATP